MFKKKIGQNYHQCKKFGCKVGLKVFPLYISDSMGHVNMRHKVNCNSPYASTMHRLAKLYRPPENEIWHEYEEKSVFL